MQPLDRALPNRPHRKSWSVSAEGVLAWSRFLPGLSRRLARPPLEDLTRVRRLGILRADGMGDLILTSGLLRELRRQLPHTKISLICQTEWAPWLRTCPWLDEVVDVRMSSHDRFPQPRQVSEAVRFVRRIWPLDLEVLVNPGTLHWYAASRALALLSGAPIRIGWEDPGAGIDTGGRLYTHCLPYPNRWHETEKCFRLLESMGLRGEGARLAMWFTADEAREGRAVAKDAKGKRKKLVAVGLTGSERQKRWPVERYVEAIRGVAAENADVAFLVLGGTDVARDCSQVASALDRDVLYPGDGLPLGAVWAAIEACDLYLGNDSGLMHMAAAAGVPVAAVIGVPETCGPDTRGDPRQTGPCGVPFRIARPRTDSCPGTVSRIEDVPVHDVVAATVELLNAR